MATAQALGRMSDAADTAIPALEVELRAFNGPQISGKHMQVMRNIRHALGDIGTGARPAIPALKRIQHLHVKYIAAEAIGKIEGTPSPTWH
jgi:hypothetical protein